MKTPLQLQCAANLRQMEVEQGYTLVADAQWLDRSDWREIVASQDGKRIRLVLLDAMRPCTGAFTQLICGIWEAGLVPVIVEPNQTLIDWCNRHDYRRRMVGHGKHRHEVWYPRRGA